MGQLPCSEPLVIQCFEKKYAICYDYTHLAARDQYYKVKLDHNLYLEKIWTFLWSGYTDTLIHGAAGQDVSTKFNYILPWVLPTGQLELIIWIINFPRLKLLQYSVINHYTRIARIHYFASSFGSVCPNLLFPFHFQIY